MMQCNAIQCDFHFVVAVNFERTVITRTLKYILDVVPIRMDSDMCTFDKYGSGVWPAGTYVERYSGGVATVRVEPYRQYNDVQRITIEVRIDGSRKRIVHRQLVECAE